MASKAEQFRQRLRRKGRKFRAAPHRFFADSSSGFVRAFGRLLSPLIMRNALVLAILEDPQQAALSRRGVFGWIARVFAARASHVRLRRLSDHGNPVVSIIMAALNAESTISESLDTLIGQSYCALEIIVIDDGSTDATRDIVRDKMLIEPRLSLIEGGPMEGAAMARNRGLKAAKGIYVGFQDADDRSHPERIERQLDALVGTEAMVVVCNACRQTPDGQQIRINGRLFSRSFISMLFVRQPVVDRIGYLRRMVVGEDAEYHARLVATFGRDKQRYLFQTLYWAQFQPDSLLFSHGITKVDEAGEVTYEQHADLQQDLAVAIEQVDEMSRGDRDPYVGFDLS